MLKKTLRSLPIVAGLLGLLLLTACGGGGSSSSGSEGTTATVSLAITDADTTYDKVVLTIKEIGVVTSDEATAYYNSDVIQELPTTVNVLDFPETATFYLGDISIHVPAGEQVCINQIRLKLAAEGDADCPTEGCNYVVEEGDTVPYPLKTPSGQQSGVKILTPNEFCVSETNDTVELAIDFDPAAAIVHNDKNTGNSDKYLLKPTGIRVIEGEWTTAAEAAGFISGDVMIPSTLTEGVCEELATDPIPVISAATTAAPAETLVTTATLAQGPYESYPTEAECNTTCSDIVDETAFAQCVATCQSNINGCYYSGPFKLLLPPEAAGPYVVTATWDVLSGQASEVAADSIVDIVVTEQADE